MATGSRGTTSELRVQYLFDALYPVRAKYKFFGLQIGVELVDIESIEKDFKNCSECFLEVLSTRLKQEPALTCEDIDKALRSRSVNELQVANDFQHKFCSKSIAYHHKKRIEETSEKMRTEKVSRSSIFLRKGEKEYERSRSTKCEEKGELNRNEGENIDESSEVVRSVNQNEDGMKALVNIFERFFGQMCQVVFDPVDAAVQLQKKGLISKQMMKNMMLSSKSQKENIIALVDALDQMVKSCPDCIFAITEVMLDNEALQETAREILREAGTRVSPAKFPQVHTFNTEVSSATERKEEVGEEVSGAVNYGCSQLTLISAGTNGSEEVSQPMPLSPVLNKYKRYLQSCYKARALDPADKYLRTLQVPYIKLAMIKREHYDSEARDEFTRSTLHGGVDEILATKAPISIEDLLVPKEGSDPVRFILVEGPPGIGKSTFAWEMCKRWDEIKSLRKYQTVVLLRLREKWVLNAKSLAGLFRYPFQPKLSQPIAEELHDSHGKNLLLVLDGFDEVSHSFHENSVIKSILCRQLLPECTIILTTRPSAKHTLENVCQPQVDKHIEIIGFIEEERERYISEVFSKEPDLQVNFKCMFHVPHIKSMMYIPLNCAIIAQVYYESQRNSHHLAIPKTRTQLYKALTHSLLVRYMKVKESNCEYSSMLPEALNREHMKNFKVLAKFAFDSYHRYESKVTFFKEDIPEGLVHFGFMNESIEMYAGKGVERTFSFLHRSLQEYLAAWHLASSYSIEFQVAYHRLAIDPYYQHRDHCYKGNEKEEEALLSSLETIGESLVEPAVFLSGVTGLKSQSEDDRSHWEMNLSHHTTGVNNWQMLLHSLYEAQNEDAIPLYFTVDTSRKHISIGSGYTSSLYTPYDCYAISYCLAHYSDQFTIDIYITNDDDVSLVETLVKGLKDHCISTTPSVEYLDVTLNTEFEEISTNTVSWLLKAKFLPVVEKLHYTFINVKSDDTLALLQSLVEVQSLVIRSQKQLRSPKPLEWLAALKNLNKLRVLSISISGECSPPQASLECGPVIKEVYIDITLPSNTECDLHSSTDGMVDSLLKSVLRSNQITILLLPNVSRETMSTVHSILLHCPNLVSLGLRKTRLGYDGILYICSALRNNKSLTRLLIHDDPHVPESRKTRNVLQFTSFSSMEKVALPDKTTCTDFLLELNNILKDNKTLQKIDIQSGQFLHLSSYGHEEYHPWTGLGPLQQFNVGAVGSGRSPNIRRSFSSSDLTKPQTLLFWDQQMNVSDFKTELDFKMLFSKQKKEGKKLFSLPSFTAPDTEVLRSFYGLDPRLKQCLGLSQLDVEYVKGLRKTYQALLGMVSKYIGRY